MKKIIPIFSFVFILSIMLFAQDTDGPVLTFEKPGVDYGTVTVDNMPDGKIAIKFTNTGNAPLVLSNVRGCCGTRIDRYPTQPIQAGGKDSINISFTLVKRPQRINRVITINSNCSNNFSYTWRITGQIIENEE